MAENVMERMERIGADRKIADIPYNVGTNFYGSNPMKEDDND